MSQTKIRIANTAGPDIVQEFADWDNSYLIRSFPQEMDVLSIHGDADEVVPVEDSADYEKILSQRTPGTHTLVIVPGAGHNYLRPYDEPVTSIMNWLAKVDPVPQLQSKL
ncbi:hypothetical protein P7C70_g772, partial [Phenoliferia sp. Uapishka_3]